MKAAYLLLMAGASFAITGCGENPLCAEQKILIESASEKTLSALNGGPRSDMLSASRDVGRLADIAEELKSKNITCKDNS
jgi:hypothetical protein